MYYKWNWWQTITQQLSPRVSLFLPDIVTVTEIQSGNDLSEESASFLGGESTFLDQVIEEFPSRHMLKNQVPIVQQSIKNVRIQSITDIQHKIIMMLFDVQYKIHIKIAFYQILSTFHNSNSLKYQIWNIFH